MKPSTRKFYLSTFTIDVLSEEPIGPDIDLADLAYDITEGNASGSVNMTGGKVIDGKEAAIALKEQGSDPEFFMLNDKGEDIE